MVLDRNPVVCRPVALNCRWAISHKRNGYSRPSAMMGCCYVGDPTSNCKSKQPPNDRKGAYGDQVNVYRSDGGERAGLRANEKYRGKEREREKSVCSGPTLPTHCYKLRNESTSWAGSSKAWPLARQNLSPPLISAHVVNHNGYGNGPAASLYWSWCVCYQKDFGIRGNQLKKRFLISIIEIPSWRMVELSFS